MAKAKKTAKRKKKSSWAPIFGLAGSAAGLVLRAFPLLLVTGSFCGLFLGVRHLLYADPQLSVKEIVVSPAPALSTGRRQDLDTKLMGKNILKVDLKKIAAELQANPEIQSAKVERQMPSTLQIEVVSRKPVAFVQFVSSGLYGAVSEDGMILDTVKARDNSLVVIEAYGMGLKEPQIGYQIRNRGFTEAVKFLHAFWDHPLSKREVLTRVSLDHLGQVSITLGAGPDIRLGRRASTRIPTLEKIMYLLEGGDRDKIQYIDLQFDNVIVKRKKS